MNFNSVNRRYHYPARTYVPFRGAFVQVDPIPRVMKSSAPAPYRRAVIASALAALHTSMRYALARPNYVVDPSGAWPEDKHRAETKAAIKGALDVQNPVFALAGQGFIECVEAWNVDVDNNHYRNPALHGQGSAANYEELLLTLRMDAVAARINQDCTGLADALGKMFHMVQDVNSHRGLSNFEHGVLDVDSPSSRNYDIRSKNSEEASAGLARHYAEELKWAAINCACCERPVQTVTGFLGKVFGAVFEIFPGVLSGTTMYREYYTAEGEWDQATGMGSWGTKLFEGEERPVAGP